MVYALSRSLDKNASIPIKLLYGAYLDWFANYPKVSQNKPLPFVLFADQIRDELRYINYDYVGNNSIQHLIDANQYDINTFYDYMTIRHPERHTHYNAISLNDITEVWSRELSYYDIC